MNESTTSLTSTTTSEAEWSNNNSSSSSCKRWWWLLGKKRRCSEVDHDITTATVMMCDDGQTSVMSCSDENNSGKIVIRCSDENNSEKAVMSYSDDDEEVVMCCCNDNENNSEKQLVMMCCCGCGGCGVIRRGTEYLPPYTHNADHHPHLHTHTHDHPVASHPHPHTHDHPVASHPHPHTPKHTYHEHPHTHDHHPAATHPQPQSPKHTYHEHPHPHTHHHHPAATHPHTPTHSHHDERTRKWNSGSNVSSSGDAMTETVMVYFGLTRTKWNSSNINLLSPAANLLQLLLLLILLLPTATFGQDSRCFLSQGGSVENFFVRESLPVGNLIGVLRLEGDAGPEGDIYLRLKEKNAPVNISPNSKNLTLTRKLDKEGKEGESHVIINVICDRRGTTDPSFTIPVNIRVTDDNDNAPIFIKDPYHVNVSEVTVVGTVILGDILAKDSDQQGPFSTVQYSIQPGPFSDMFAFESALRGSLVLKKPLDFETFPEFNITIIAEDQAAVPQRTSALLTVKVQDADDQNPAFLRDHYMAVLPLPPVKGALVEVQPDQVHAEDRDVGIMAPVYYSFSREEEEAAWFNIDPESGEVSLAEDLPDTHLNQPTTLVVRATQVDNPDRYALTTMTLSRRGYYSTQLQFIQRDYVATVLESLPIHSLIAPTLINKNTKENIKFQLERDGDGVFRITPSGQIMLQHQLDFETQQEYNLNVYVSDGVFNDTASLKVQVLNVNDWDPRFKFPQYEFYVGSDTVRPGDAVGNVDVADGDRGDHITLVVMGQDAQMFAISNDGELRIRDLSTLNSTEAHIVVRAKDSGIPPRTASSPVTIHFPVGLVRSSPLAVSSSFLLVVIFGSLLALFILVIICLAVYIHKNKKCGDDNDAALPTKMSHIVTNNIPHTKLDPLSPLNHQMQGNVRHMTQLGEPDPTNVLAGIESPTAENNNTHAHTNNNDYNNGSVRTSTISVRSAALTGDNGRYLRNPLANGSLPTTTTTTTTTTTPCNSPHHHIGYIGGVGDGVSLNGTVRSSSSTASLAATPEPVLHTARSYQGSSGGSTLRPQSGLGENDHCFSPAMGAMSKSSSPGGSARAVGGLPIRNKVGPVPPTPPVPANTPYPEAPSSPGGSLSGSLGPSSKVLWPQGSIPKRVKKLSWEDELSNKTELDPEVSVTPMPHSASDTPNLTVYF